jgi:hypothetical protein
LHTASESVIASAAKQSIATPRKDGLHRCARNDGKTNPSLSIRHGRA